jgi:tRNA modification GTPase
VSGADTIFALSTARGRSAIAVIRVSGPRAREALASLAPRCVPQPRVAKRAKLVDPATGETIDIGLALWFPRPASFTGEDVVGASRPRRAGRHRRGAGGAGGG